MAILYSEDDDFFGKMQDNKLISKLCAIKHGWREKTSLRSSELGRFIRLASYIKLAKG